MVCALKSTQFCVPNPQARVIGPNDFVCSAKAPDISSVSFQSALHEALLMQSASEFISMLRAFGDNEA